MLDIPVMPADPEERAVHLPALLVRVRLPLLTPQFLADRVATEELIRSSHKCRDLLDEARDYHLMPERRPQLKGSSIDIRDFSQILPFCAKQATLYLSIQRC